MLGITGHHGARAPGFVAGGIGSGDGLGVGPGFGLGLLLIGGSTGCSTGGSGITAGLGSCQNGSCASCHTNISARDNLEPSYINYSFGGISGAVRRGRNIFTAVRFCPRHRIPPLFYRHPSFSHPSRNPKPYRRAHCAAKSAEGDVLKKVASANRCTKTTKRSTDDNTSFYCRNKIRPRKSIANDSSHPFKDPRSYGSCNSAK